MNREAVAPLNLQSLLHTAHEVQAEVEAELGAAGLSLSKLLALRALAEAGGALPLGRLAERLSCVRSNVTQLVDRLEADGWVARVPDPHDRRTRLAVLTGSGRRACTAGTRIRQRSERQLFTALTREEARRLGVLLGKLRKHRPSGATASSRSSTPARGRS